MKQWSLVEYVIRTYGLENTTAASLLTLGGVLLCIIIPYLLGSVNFGVIISNREYHDDIRTHGSGNAGATNMLRTYGTKAAVLTMLGDMLKAVFAVGLGYFLVGAHAIHPETSKIIPVDEFGAAIAGLFVMLGHMFPIFFKFKGGKGVATSAMVILMISPITCLFCFIVFAVIVIGTRFVSLASIMGMTFYPIILSAFSGGRNPTARIVSVFMAVLVVFMHRENIKRLREGKESKVSFGKKKAADGTSPAHGETDSPAAETAPAEPKPNLGNDPTAKRKGNKKNKSKK